MRTVVAFLVTLLLLIGGGLAVDAMLTDRAERTIGERLGEQLGAETNARVGPWPVTLWLLSGQVPEVVLSARDVPVGEVAIRRLTLELRDVRIDGAAALAVAVGDEPASMALRAAQGRLDAELDEEAVGVLVGAPVRFSDGRAVITTPVGELQAVAGVEEGAVVLRPVGDVPEGVRPLRFEPPPLPGDARLVGVQLREGAAHLTAEVRHLDG